MHSVHSLITTFYEEQLSPFFVKAISWFLLRIPFEFRSIGYEEFCVSIWLFELD